MDLSWCIICDRHCADNDLYCSEVCRFQDTDGQKPMLENTTSMFDKAPSLVSPPASPIMSPLLYSFQPVYHAGRRSAATAGNMMHASYSTSSASTSTMATNYHYIPYQLSPSSSLSSLPSFSLYDEDT